jgi:transposase
VAGGEAFHDPISSNPGTADPGRRFPTSAPCARFHNGANNRDLKFALSRHRASCMGLMEDITYVGLDVHKATVCAAVAEGGRSGGVRQLGIFENRPEVLIKMATRLARGGSRLNFCYEAGPCGYGLHRLLTGRGHDCVVVAPSLIPMKAGDRVKTDRRDAMMLAKLHRAGELTPIWIPDAAHEAMRDLVRARATAVRVLSKARQHLQGFLLRHDRIYRGARAWTLAYRRWLTRYASIIRRSRSCCRVISMPLRTPNSDATG